MKLSDLELFLRVTQETSLNRAAEKSFITEAALSQRLKKIEAELQTELFYRQKGKKIQLTEKGFAFQKTAEAILKEYSCFLNMLGPKNRPVHIGVSIRQSDMAIDVLKTMAQDFSPSRYVFVETGHQEREAMVESGELDLAYTSLPLSSRNLDYTVVRRQPLGIYLRKGHPMAQTAHYKSGCPIPYIGLEVLNDEPFLLPGHSMPHQHSLVLQILNRYHVMPKIEGIFRTLSYGAITAAEGTHSSISLPSKNSAGEYENFFLIDECSIVYEMAIVYRKGRKQDPDIQSIIRCFKEYFKRSGACPGVSAPGMK